MFGFLFGKKEVKKTVASITSVYTAMISELLGHAEEEAVKIKQAENEIAVQQGIAKEARAEAENAKAVAEKLKKVFEA